MQGARAARGAPPPRGLLQGPAARFHASSWCYLAAHEYRGPASRWAGLHQRGLPPFSWALAVGACPRCWHRGQGHGRFTVTPGSGRGRARGRGARARALAVWPTTRPGVQRGRSQHYAEHSTTWRGARDGAKCDQCSAQGFEVHRLKCIEVAHREAPPPPRPARPGARAADAAPRRWCMRSVRWGGPRATKHPEGWVRRSVRRCAPPRSTVRKPRGTQGRAKGPPDRWRPRGPYTCYGAVASCP